MASKTGPTPKTADLAALWKRAVDDYEKKTERKLSFSKNQSIDDVKKSMENELQEFQNRRHKGDKVDRVRSAFGRQLDNMQNCLEIAKAAGAVLRAFPPAAPAEVIFSACGHLLAVSLLLRDYRGF